MSRLKKRLEILNKVINGNTQADWDLYCEQVDRMLSTFKNALDAKDTPKEKVSLLKIKPKINLVWIDETSRTGTKEDFYKLCMYYSTPRLTLADLSDHNRLYYKPDEVEDYKTPITETYEEFLKSGI